MRLFIVAPFGSSYVRDPGWVSPSAKLSVHIRMAPTIDRDHSLRDYCWAAAAAALRRAHAALLASDRADPDLSLLPGFLLGCERGLDPLRLAGALLLGHPARERYHRPGHRPGPGAWLTSRSSTMWTS